MSGLFELIRAGYVKYPEKAFIRRQDQTWTYRDVYQMAQAVSGALEVHGIGKGEPVILFCDNSVQYVAAYFGILGCKAVAVPVNPARMTESLLHIIEVCDSRLVLSCDVTNGKLDRVRDRLSAIVLNIDRICRLDRTGSGEDEEPLPEIPLESSTEIPLESSTEIPLESSLDENDPALILFTSGTTAQPKGVVLTHANLMANTRAILDYLHLTCGDSILMTLPFSYSYGNSVLLTHTCVGASIIIEAAAAYPYKVLEGIKRYRVTGFSTVGSYINLMLNYVRNCRTAENFFETLNYITFAGESTNMEDIDFLNGAYPLLKIYVMYGQTEAGARLSYLCPDLLRSRRGSIGKGLSNVELQVVDENGGPVKPGEIGEIIARGPNIMKGYWRDPDATEEVLENGWLHTRDCATVDEDGYIYIKGRKTDMIKHMGHRIGPVEIESVINSCQGIRESAVIEDTSGPVPVIKAFLVLDTDCDLDSAVRQVNSGLPNYMRPAAFVPMDALPRTESGKIQRSALRRNK